MYGHCVLAHLDGVEVFKILFVAFHVQLSQPTRDWNISWVVRFCSHRGTPEFLAGGSRKKNKHSLYGTQWGWVWTALDVYCIASFLATRYKYTAELADTCAKLRLSWRKQNDSQLSYRAHCNKYSHCTKNSVAKTATPHPLTRHGTCARARERMWLLTTNHSAWINQSGYKYISRNMSQLQNKLKCTYKLKQKSIHILVARYNGM